ncbi:hypothetical protein FRC0036_01878 [Corynebacterium diphtheriae]|nr:hypothetical protein FRC0030_01878 [Corynebacterium diphtheriae]CAB0709246.1 hypothetical protein FRC0025_01904 [Corynebacterium diphtheriae]CAB0709278.1 hypothetical protein FRC0036_01878 [Corynebacterium diphtheriae]CAB0710499.1 hypothetical protein FRC0024_01956 [Corynebacterium diphtheriae]CAB0734420.1 hypothetical protein FRC0101_01783 [Corynebacterium diphtheriae]
MVGAWVWVWWWGFRGHGFENTDSYWRIREHTNQPLLPDHCTGEQAGPAGERVDKLEFSTGQVHGSRIVFCVYAKILFFVLNGTSNVPLTTIFGAAFLVF